MPPGGFFETASAAVTQWVAANPEPVLWLALGGIGILLYFLGRRRGQASV